jgi:hypothetical protein
MAEEAPKRPLAEKLDNTLPHIKRYETSVAPSLPIIPTSTELASSIDILVEITPSKGKYKDSIRAPALKRISLNTSGTR